MELPTDREVMDLFPHLYEGYKPTPREIDEDLGLEIVQKETVLSKYGIRLYNNNSFHMSLKSFFEKTGYLTTKQLEAVRR